LPKQLEKKDLGLKIFFLKAAEIDDKRVEMFVLVKVIDEKKNIISPLFTSVSGKQRSIL